MTAAFVLDNTRGTLRPFSEVPTQYSGSQAFHYYPIKRCLKKDSAHVTILSKARSGATHWLFVKLGRKDNLKLLIEPITPSAIVLQTHLKLPVPGVPFPANSIS